MDEADPLWHTLLRRFNKLLVVPEPYAASQSLLTGDADVCVERFLETDCDLLFGAEGQFRPDAPCFEELKKFEAKQGYLNDSLWIGKKDFCEKFFAECASTKLWQIFDCRNVTGLDQAVKHFLYRKYYPRVRVDRRREIFQVLPDAAVTFSKFM